jgi:hypothetical protein
MQSRDRIFTWLWNYLRGWLIIAILGVMLRFFNEAYSRIALGFEPLLGDLGPGFLRTVAAVAALVLVPWVLGHSSEIALRLLRGHRGWRAVERMEKRLATELRPDKEQGFRIALIDYPSSSTRTLAVVTETYLEPETDRQLASVYLPGTPDPTKGWLRIVAVEDLVFVDWTLRHLIRYHATFGSAGLPFSTFEDPAGS